MRKLSVFLSMAFAMTMIVVPQVQAASYDIDVTHSTLGFAVKHLGVGTTRGNFTEYEGSITLDDSDWSTFSADVVIQATSIDTDVEKRDDHLRAEDFFHVEAFPTITFKSTRLEKRGEGAVIVGDLTMKGVTKQLTIPVSLTGPVSNPFGEGKIMGLEASLILNRQDYGISFNKTLDNGGLVVADEVKVVIEIEAHSKS